MAKVFFCRDLEVSCKWGCSGETAEDVLRQVMAHALEKHGCKKMTEMMLERIKAKIREQEPTD
ncbi:MAG: DUF1059 domain-containing protein [Nitrospirae bacterium]|nr:DUF1059 domain-containing protein [Nitrospirota bacterium]